MKKKKYAFFALLLIPFLFLGCSKKGPFTQKPTVLVSISPYQTFVKMIAGETVDIKVAVPEDFNAHLYEPTPRQMNDFDKASLWFQIGMPFEISLSKTLSTQNPNLTILNLSEGMGGPKQESLTFDACHGHSHDEEDIHYWMSPPLVKIQMSKIANALSQKFPKNEKLYANNLTRAIEGLTNLNDELKTILEPQKGKAIITSHPSLTYFCEQYGLIQISIECEGKSPLPKDISRILKLTESYDILCVLTQEQFDNKGALAIAKRLNLPTIGINPHAQLYYENMLYIAEKINLAGWEKSHE